MSDYIQDTEKGFITELIAMKIVTPNGEILDTNKYITWLQSQEKNLSTQIQQIPEPGDVYDRYRANLLYKKIDTIRDMILHQTGTQIPNRESEIIEKVEKKMNAKRDIIGKIRKILGRSK